MNSYQKVWWQQAISDHEAFVLIRGLGVAQCHALRVTIFVSEIVRFEVVVCW